jgi:hypothetical protein
LQRAVVTGRSSFQVLQGVVVTGGRLCKKLLLQGVVVAGSCHCRRGGIMHCSIIVHLHVLFRGLLIVKVHQSGRVYGWITLLGVISSGNCFARLSRLERNAIIPFLLFLTASTHSLRGSVVCKKKCLSWHPDIHCFLREFSRLLRGFYSITGEVTRRIILT